MRELETELGGRPIRLAANFKASLEIAEKVGDPLTIMREAALEAMFMARGIPYEPKWKFSVKNVTQIIFIGARAAKESLTLEDIQDLVFEMGFVAAQEIAGDYLALIVGPRPKETIAEKDGEESSGNPGGPTS